MKKTFIKISSEEESRSVQDLLYKNGHRWVNGEKYQYLNKPYLVIYGTEVNIRYSSRGDGLVVTPNQLKASYTPLYKAINGVA